MNHPNNRRDFLQKLGALTVAAGAGLPSLARGNPRPASSESSGRPGPVSFHMDPVFLLPELKSLPPEQLFSVLDLDRPDMATVRSALKKRGRDAALTALLERYRKRFPKPSRAERTGSEAERRMIRRADDMEKHIFQRDPYPAADYGKEIDWGADPAGDIEWVAQINRFYWTRDLIGAYRITGEERYVRILVDLATDWFRKHPLETTLRKIHPVYSYWQGYVWLDIETGRRAVSICEAVRAVIHSPEFTPDFLGTVLASLYDHQNKIVNIPMGHVHNKSIFEQRGFVHVIHTFPEYREKEEWLDLAMRRSHEMLIAQTTLDGVQREYTGGYHNGVYADGLFIETQMRELGRTMPEEFRERLRKMADYTFGISTPDLAFPMFGDTARSRIRSGDRRRWPLYRHLSSATEQWKDPKYRALAELDRSALPENGSTPFPEAGLYALRSSWDPEQVYMALHCSPPAISSHDQPDNGTFELYAYGRWLMPDSGYFTYGNDPEARAWHRQTRVHATMTSEGADTEVKGRHILWESDPDRDLLCVENQSYQYLTHRRTVWFSGKRSDLPFFVLLDEAIGTPPHPQAPEIEGVGGFDPIFRGETEANLELHFPMAPGPVTIDPAQGTIFTGFEDANLLIRVYGKRPLQLKEGDGWHAWAYGQREPRTIVTASWRPSGPAERGPFTFVSVLLPYRGNRTPTCRLITPPETLVAGSSRVELEVEVGGRRHRLSRAL